MPINKNIFCFITLVFLISKSVLAESGTHPQCQNLFQNESIINLKRSENKLIFSSNKTSGLRKKFLILEPTPWDRRELISSGVSERYELDLPAENWLSSTKYFGAVIGNVNSWVKKTAAKLKNQGYDGIIGIQDFPASLIASSLGEEMGFRVPKLDVMLSIHNKYLSRMIQQRAAPEAVPPFALVDTAKIDVNNPPLPYPFFLKPVKGLSSIKAQVVRGPEDFLKAVRLTWTEKLAMKLLFRPLDELMKSKFEDPILSRMFIAEGLMKGVQVTVDGFVQNGKVQILGVVDSFMYKDTNSFESFQYPSRLSPEVQNRMNDIAKKVMAESGFDHSLFNIEMFYDAETNHIGIIEINPRMAYQFADLYEKVDGVNLYTMQAQLSAGEAVTAPHRQGQFKTAGSFVPRVFAGQILKSFPTEARAEEIQNAEPDSRIRLIAKEGLASLKAFQDVDSTRLAFVNIGGSSFEQLRQRALKIYERLGIVIQDKNSQ